MGVFLKIFSWIISILFHPLLYASLGSFVILFFLPQYSAFNIEYSFKFLQFIFLLTFITPLVAVPLYFLALKITKSNPSEYHKRIFLLVTTSILYVFSYRILQNIALYEFVSVYMLLCSILMVLSLIITYFWKISLHMIGIGGFTGLILSLCIINNPIAIVILPFCFAIAGIIGTSRLYLQAHSQLQVYIGFILGLSVSIGFLQFFLF